MSQLADYINGSFKATMERQVDGMRNDISKRYEKLPMPVRYAIPSSDRSFRTLLTTSQKANKSKYVPKFVTKGLLAATGAVELKKQYNMLPEKYKRRGGKKSKKQNSYKKKQNSYKKKSKKQNTYTKKEKKKINGVTKVIYTKKKSKKLYVKSKGRMINLKKYKKILQKK